ncbi:MAG TPA: DedA family protein [Allosphingosinicella sp.]|nr:DedA family protein [Allosphingosinicella sp.]
MIDHGLFHQLMTTYGLWALFGIVMLESMGLPLPGETALVSAALYAGATGHFQLWEVIAVAFVAAVIGDTAGYWIGRTLGFRLLARYGRHIRITEERLKIGRYLFRRHGGKIVFFGRFVALLRVLAALLAGANHMPWPRFFVMNAAGGLAWAASFATAAYVFGDRVSKVEGPIAIGLLVLVGLGIAFALFTAHRYEKQMTERILAEEAEADECR